ncbi:hypothetical protein H0A36_23925 [Endozoicomonas sp. SM1973]|uniref:Uncharacterized protein n=1 Tax=Spartinivicinus marinus TaxID=2994442 RepID=A0A853I6Y6_9GAMM|nr:hypothetical protein [Spartinivicinus marinus]MCX4027678.1 hypothetical protein [Spartinivicinus marinus]NYZ69073.1 hypothetical protein [Spartinivicinus marinus]
MEAIQLTPEQEQALATGKIQVVGQNKVYWLCEAELHELNPFIRLSVKDAIAQAETLNFLLQTLLGEQEADGNIINYAAADREGMTLVIDYIMKLMQFLAIKQPAETTTF